MAANNLSVGKDWFYLLGFLTLAALFVGLGFIFFGPAHLIPMLLVPKLASAWPAFAHAIAAIPTLVASLIEAAVWGIVISAAVTVISVPLKLYERLAGWLNKESAPTSKKEAPTLEDDGRLNQLSRKNSFDDLSVLMVSLGNESGTPPSIKRSNSLPHLMQVADSGFAQDEKIGNFDDLISSASPETQAQTHFKLFLKHLGQFYQTANDLLLKIDELFKLETGEGLVLKTKYAYLHHIISETKLTLNDIIFADFIKTPSARKHIPEDQEINFCDLLFLVNIAYVTQANFNLQNQARVLVNLPAQLEAWLPFMCFDTERSAEYPIDEEGYRTAVKSLDQSLDQAFKHFYQGLHLLRDGRQAHAAIVLESVQSEYLHIPADSKAHQYTPQEIEVKKSSTADTPQKAYAFLHEFLNNNKTNAESMQTLLAVLKKPSLQSRFDNMTIKLHDGQVNVKDYINSKIIPGLEKLCENPFEGIEFNPEPDQAVDIDSKREADGIPETQTVEQQFDDVMKQVFNLLAPSSQKNILAQLSEAYSTYLSYVTVLLLEVFNRTELLERLAPEDRRTLENLPAKPSKFATDYQMTFASIANKYGEYFNSTIDDADARKEHALKASKFANIKQIYEGCVQIADTANKSAGIIRVNRPISMQDYFPKWLRQLTNTFSPAKQPAPSGD